jgi:hypothetical protein
LRKPDRAGKQHAYCKGEFRKHIFPKTLSGLL